MTTTKKATSSTALLLKIGSDEFYKTKRGIERSAGGNEELICAPIRFAANVRDLESGTVRVKVIFRDAGGAQHALLAPKAELLRPYRIIQRLANHGFEIHEPAVFRELLPELLRTQRPQRTITVTDRPGWHRVGEGLVYLTPAWMTGAGDNDEPSLELLPSSRSAIAVKGTVASWNQAVGELCSGSALPVMGICAALTAPVLYLLHEANIGLGFVGPSSTGKSTALAAAATVFGPAAKYLDTFDATPGALDAMALARSDAPLVLDELGEGDPRVTATACYGLLNGRTRRRLGTDRQLNPADTLRLALIFSGELTVAEHLREGNIQAKTGQIIRLAAIPVPEAGMFANNENFSDTGKLVRAVQQGCANHYGAVGRKWVELLSAHPESSAERLRSMASKIAKTLLQEAPDGLPSNVAGRIAESMALVGAAGEYAIAKRVLLWERGIAAKAVRHCFNGWARQAMAEHAVASEDPLAAVRRFFQSESGGRFEAFEEYHDVERKGLAGFEYVLKGTPVFLVYQQYFAERFCKTMSLTTVVGALKRENLLVADSDGRPTKQVRIPGDRDKRRVGFYVIRKSIIES